MITINTNGVIETRPTVTVSGPAGVLSVKSSEILKSTEGRRQLKALEKIKCLHEEFDPDKAVSLVCSCKKCVVM